MGPSGLAVSVIFLSEAPDGGLKGIPVNQGGGEKDLSFQHRALLPSRRAQPRGSVPSSSSCSSGAWSSGPILLREG